VRSRIAAIVLPLLLLARSSAALAPPVPQDAYVWQRVWTPALRGALAQSAGLVAGWRVLAAETDARGELRPVAIDWDALAETTRPVILVVRIDGALARLPEARLLAQIQTLATAWRAHRPAGLEIDYDCGTARLAGYARLLARLRGLPHIPRRISITALPAWMASPDLPRVLVEADEAVLQVHAVRAPQDGLFDPEIAKTWASTFAAITTKPFRVALPDYGVRTVFDEDGRLVAVESEMPRLAGGTGARELMAMPADVAKLLRALQASPPSHFGGVVWFRLPSDDDAQTWSLATWHAVMRGADLHSSVTIAAKPAETPGMLDIVLANTGAIDALIPRAVRLPADCRVADGINGYALEDSGANLSLRRLQTALLRAHHDTTIGWMRCARPVGALDVQE
jgi:hypothetical protein